MATYDSVDAAWSFDGDYQIGHDGDLKDTSSDYLLSVVNEIQTVVKSEFGDWAKDPNVGANLSDFVGEANDRDTGKAIEDRIRSRIVAIGIVRPEDLKIGVLPVSRHEVMISISVNATATSLNNLTPGEPLTVTLVYDTLENNTFFFEESASSRQDRSF